MQTTPALPWANGQGGTIQLSEPVTVQQLLDGALKFTVIEDEGGDPTEAEVYMAFDKIEVGDTKTCYEIANFEGATNVLTVTARDNIGVQLLSVVRA